MARIFSSIVCKELQTFATPLVHYRITRTPPWRWATDHKFTYFVALPAGIGGAYGCALGTYEGFRISHKDILPFNVLCTAGGCVYGTTICAIAAGLWPVFLPFTIARAYFPGDETSVFSWNMFKTYEKNKPKTT